MKGLVHSVLLTIVLLAGFPLQGHAISITGKVVAVQDGDTLTVLTDAKEQNKVRLDGIDAPESKQPFGSVSKQSLSEMTFGKIVRVEVSGKDRYQRTLGHVYAEEVWVNLEQVRKGYAWHYKKYNKDPRIDDAEQMARQAKRGLWSEASPVAPWEWRVRSKKKAAP